jgi:hypothetical protein
MANEGRRKPPLVQSAAKRRENFLVFRGVFMAVLKNRRGLSKLEFYHNARKMRKELTALTLRDFGAHSRGAGFKTDAEQQPPEGYYDELLKEFSDNIRMLLRNLMLNITAANTVFPQNAAELQTRRDYQTRAIINCEQLLQEMLYCGDALPVKASKFLPYIEQIEYEIKLLKGWRRANSKIAEALAEKERKKEGGDKKID